MMTHSRSPTSSEWAFLSQHNIVSTDCSCSMWHVPISVVWGCNKWSKTSELNILVIKMILHEDWRVLGILVKESCSLLVNEVLEWYTHDKYAVILGNNCFGVNLGMHRYFCLLYLVPLTFERLFLPATGASFQTLLFEMHYLYLLFLSGIFTV